MLYGGCWKIVAMDLNASPVPEEDEDTFEQHIEEDSAPEERIESAVAIARRVLLFSLSWKALHISQYELFVIAHDNGNFLSLLLAIDLNLPICEI